MISLILPTRGRPALVARLFASITKMTSRLDQIEVVLYIDQDDLTSHTLGSENFSVTKIIGPRLGMGSCNSACLAKARGEVLVLVNDDIVIRAQNWDDHVRATHAEFKDQIYLAYPNDLFKKSKFCTFPIISRRTCELLIDPYPEIYQRGFIDVHLFDIFKRLQHAGYDRIRYYSEIIFEHLHYRTGKAPYDTTYDHARKKRFTDDPVFIALIKKRSVTANRLINAIQGKPVISDTNTDNHTQKISHAQPTNILSAVRLFSRKFLLDNELPYKWRLFLWYWFIGRYLAVKGLLVIKYFKEVNHGKS